MPDRAVSRKQWRFLMAVASGHANQAHSLSPDKAKEMLGGQTPTGLPEKAPAVKRKKRY